MAQLGHSARIAVFSRDVPASLTAWLLIGFTVLDLDHETSPTMARTTDGQLIVTIMEGAHPSPALAYFNAAPMRTAQQSKDRGAPNTVLGPKEVEFAGPGGLMIWVHEQSIDKVVHVDDLDASRRWAEAIGMLVLDTTGGTQPTIDVTDGLMTLSLRTMAVAGRPLEYSADIDAETVQILRDALGDACQATLDANGEPLFIRLTMPEGTTILVGRDE
jgi:hypothetical protein